MAIYTPRGLKIRLPLNLCFGLMARLSPKITPFKILKTVEGLEVIPSLLGMVSGAYVLYLNLTPETIFLCSLVGFVVGVLISYFGLFVFPGLVLLAILYTYVAGFGLIWLLIVGWGVYFSDWKGVVAFFLAMVISEGIRWVLEFIKMKKSYALSGICIGMAEQNFLNSYRLHAKKIGLGPECDLKEEELNKEDWIKLYYKFLSEWPEIVARFSERPFATQYEEDVFLKKLGEEKK